MFDYKNQFQRWIGTIPFSYNVVVEPSPSHPFSTDEIRQRFRQIIWDLNKKYLKCSFPKWEAKNKFWMMVFPEGDGVKNEIHYHGLLYVPKALHHSKIGANPAWDLQIGWLRLPSINPLTGQPRTMITRRKNKFHTGPDDLEIHLPLHVEKIRSVERSSIYASKWVHRSDYSDFVVGLD